MDAVYLYKLFYNCSFNWIMPFLENVFDPTVEYALIILYGVSLVSKLSDVLMFT